MITRKRLTIIPITANVIKRVEELATRQGFKSLKFLNRKKEEFMDAEIENFAGVPEDDDNSDDENDEDDEDSEDESDDEDNDDDGLENLKTDLRANRMDRDKIVDFEIQRICQLETK